jgi:uncharacterized membrane protein YdbT with pleckstrin-like domain
MSYLSRLLIPGEEVLLLARRSVTATFGALLLLEAVLLAAAAGLYLWNAPGTGAGPGVGVILAVALIVLGLLAVRYVRWRNKVYVVTNLRVLKVEGTFAKAHHDASLDKINDLVLTQSVWGRVFGYGDLQILTANEASGVTFHYLHDPVGFKRTALESRTALGGAAAAGGTPAAVAALDPLAQIERLGELRSKNLISEDEFQKKKAELLSRVR